MTIRVPLALVILALEEPRPAQRPQRRQAGTEHSRLGLQTHSVPRSPWPSTPSQGMASSTAWTATPPACCSARGPTVASSPPSSSCGRGGFGRSMSASATAAFPAHCDCSSSPWPRAPSRATPGSRPLRPTGRLQRRRCCRPRTASTPMEPSSPLWRFFCTRADATRSARTSRTLATRWWAMLGMETLGSVLLGAPASSCMPIASVWT
mmetsp:Transcript_15427/g.48489  ORF Transcript_15427/g.48489 Transcript_15427/m.48489 type:complete len:208 (+) Transcript_15427:542-1165(+)